MSDALVREGILSRLSDGKAWRFRDISLALGTVATSDVVYRELRRLVAESQVRRIRHGLYIRAGGYDWEHSLKEANASPVIRQAVLSLLDRARSPDEIAALLDLKIATVWLVIRHLVQDGSIAPVDPLGVHVQQRFLTVGSIQAAPSRPESATSDSADREREATIPPLSPGAIYSAHELACYLGVSTRSAKEIIAAESAVGRLRAFSLNDGILFFSRLANQSLSSEAGQLRPLNFFAELGLDAVTVLNIVANRGPVAASELAYEFARQTGRPVNASARFLTKLRRAGFLSATELSSEQVWSLTQLGEDISKILDGHAPNELPSVRVDALRYEMPAAEPLNPAVLTLARFVVEAAAFHRRGPSARIPINKALLARSLGISGGHLNRCLRSLQPFGVTYKAGDLIVADVQALARLLGD